MEFGHCGWLNTAFAPSGFNSPHLAARATPSGACSRRFFIPGFEEPGPGIEKHMRGEIPAIQLRDHLQGCVRFCRARRRMHARRALFIRGMRENAPELADLAFGKVAE